MEKPMSDFDEVKQSYSKLPSHGKLLFWSIVVLIGAVSLDIVLSFFLFGKLLYQHFF
jgi:hypothetical protein